MSKEERLKEAFYYLRDRGIVHTQKDLADAMKTTPQNMSKAMHGVPSVLTDSFCKRIQKHFKMISADWLITGKGEMIVDTNSNNSKQIATQQQHLPDYSSLMNATIAAKDEAIASLKRELEAKDMLIKSLQQQVSDLSFALSALKEKSTVGYAFPMGIAEPDAAECGTTAQTKKAKPTAKFPSARK